MNVDARAEAWVSLQLSGLTPRALFRLLRAFGSPEAIREAPTAQLRNVVAPPQVDALRSKPPPDRLRAALSWLAGASASIVAWDDADYPRALLEIGDPPPVLYCLGERRF